MIDNAVLNDKRLSFKARGVLGYLLSKPENWEIRMNDLVAASPDGIHAAQGALKELQTIGYASLIPYKENGKLVGRRWILHETPKDMSDNRQGKNCLIGDAPTRQFSDRREIRSSENPIVEKVPQLVRSNTNNNKSIIIDNDVVVVGENSTPTPPPTSKKIENGFLKFENENENGVNGANYTVSSTATPPPPPQVAARPPAPVALPWQASADYQAGPVSFGEALKGRGVLPENTDTDYYYGRGAEWSANSAARTGTVPLAADWLGKIHGWATADMNAGKLHTIQQTQHTAYDGTKYTVSGNPAYQGGPAGPSQQPRRARGEINTEAAIAGGQRVLERLRAHGLYLPKNDG